MPLLFSLTQCGLSDLKAGEVCQKQAEAVPREAGHKPAFLLSEIILSNPKTKLIA